MGYIRYKEAKRKNLQTSPNIFGKVKIDNRWRLTNENSMPCSLGLLGVIGFDSLWHSQGFLLTLLDDSPVTLAVLGGDRYFATATYHSARRRVSRLV